MSSDNVVEVPHFCKKHVAFLVGVTPRTVQRWIDDGKIAAHQVGFSRAWYVGLPEINRIRNLYAYPSLTREQAEYEITNNY